MALITLAAFSGATLATLAIPVNSGLSSRCIREVFVQSDGAAAAQRMGVSIPFVRANGGVSFTLLVSNESNSINGFHKELTRDTYFVNANVICTMTMFTSTGMTGHFGICFDEVPKTGGMTGT